MLLLKLRWIGEDGKSLQDFGTGLAEQVQREAVEQAGGDAHGQIKNLSVEQYEILSWHPSIRECGREMFVADSVENPEFLKHHVEMHYLDEKSMELLWLVPAAGCEVTLKIRPHFYSEPVERTFTVSGVIETSRAMKVGFVFVSEAYLEKYGEEIRTETGPGVKTERKRGRKAEENHRRRKAFQNGILQSGKK